MTSQLPSEQLEIMLSHIRGMFPLYEVQGAQSEYKGANYIQVIMSREHDKIPLVNITVPFEAVGTIIPFFYSYAMQK